MNQSNIHEPDLDKFLQQALGDDLPPEAEAGMNRPFLSLKRTLDRTERLPEPGGWLWILGTVRKEILAVASATMLILGIVLQLSGSQRALAQSIEQLKVVVTVTMGLNRASSMDCIVLKPEVEGKQTSYHVRWRKAGETRVDLDSATGRQTLWISDQTVSIAGPDGAVRSVSTNTMVPGPKWEPALEFMSPALLARHIEESYGLMQSTERSAAGIQELVLEGRGSGQDVEIAIDAKTYLPKTMKKYSRDSDRLNGAPHCTLEVQFLWNQPIAAGVFSPRIQEAGR